MENSGLKLNISPAACYVLDKLERAGYEARPVGGCVRDMLMGKPPQDWDVCSSALPEELLRVFSDDKTLTVGLKHGTVTVLYKEEPIEVTSYRAEAGYSDCRHPDSVRFVRSIEEDLSRRDFTVNAMAWDRKSGLIDLFGGQDDLRAKIIRCVGEPSQRFGEDALRILRALRFASRFGFALEETTAAAVHTQKELLGAVSKERIFTELKGIVMGEYAGKVLYEFSDVIEVILPGAKPFDDAAPLDFDIRMALLLRSCEPAVINSLRCEGELKKSIHRLLETPKPDSALDLRRLTVQYGRELTGKILRFHGEDEQQLEIVLQDCDCLSLHALAVSGNDLAQLGYTGRTLGQMLDTLLDKILSDELENNREALLAYAKERLHK